MLTKEERQEIKRREKLQKMVRVPLENLQDLEVKMLDKFEEFLKNEDMCNFREIGRYHEILREVLTPDFRKTILNVLYLRGMREENSEYKDLYACCSAVLSDHITAYIKLSGSVHIKVLEIIELLHNDKLLKSVLPEDIYRDLKEKLKVLDANYEKTHNSPEKRKQQILAYDPYIELLLHSRYTDKEIQSLTGLNPRSRFEEPARSIMEEFYGKETVDKINEIRGKGFKIKHTDAKPYLIKDPEMIKAVKEEIIEIDAYNMKLLRIVLEYCRCYGNLDQTFKILPDTPYNFIWYSLNEPDLPGLLSDEMRSSFELYLKMHNDMESIPYSKRKKFVLTIVKAFFEYNGNISRLMDEFSLEKEEVYKALHDNIVLREYGEEVYQKITDEIKSYEDRQFVIKELQKVKMLEK